MKEIDCTVCEDLASYAIDLISNGEVTEKTCTSLINDTGLNPDLTVLHTDCEDLEDMNDCLIGRPEQDLERYDNCDWRKFLRKFISNLHTFNKAVLCAICGLWSNIHSLWGAMNTANGRLDDLEDRVDSLCQLLNQQINKNMDVYGTLPGSGFDNADARKGGEIVDNHGEPAVVQSTPGSWDGVGFYYKKSVFMNCEGVSKTYEWIQPYIRNYSYNTNTVYNDVIWKVSVTQLLQWGVTQSLITQFTSYPQWWNGYCRSWGEYFGSTLHMQVVNGYREIKLIGATAGGYTGKVISGLTKDPFMWIS